MEPIQDLPNFFSDNNPGLGGPAKTELDSFFDRPPGLSAAPPRTTSKSADLGAVLAQEGAEHLRPVVEAIYQQESGAGANAGVSVDGARGGMQIMPDTFRRFAKAGERIDDPEDNARVGVRIIKNLARRFGDDPARIAAGYFSGEGNVNPQGGDAWKEDRADGNGKRVSGYVNDVLGRLPKAPSTPDAAGPDLSRAPKWADVMAKPEFAALSPELQAETKAAYFDYWIAPHAGQQGADLRAQFLKAPAPQPGAPDRLPATPPGTQGLPGTADFMTEAVSAAPQERTAPPAPPELPTTSKAPVRPELRAQFQAHWDAATDQERQAMQARPGWMGMLARERAGVFEGVDRLQETLPSDNALAAVDPRVEYRRARLARAGEAPEFADRAAREGAQAGVAPGAEIKALNGVMGATDFDFDTKALFDTKGAMTGLNNPLTRGVAKGVLGVGKAATGYMEFLADTTGADVEAERMRQAGNFLRGKEEAIGEQGDHLSRNLEGAISSIAQQLPLMVAGVKLASQAIPLAGIALQSFGQEYSDGRARGQSAAQAAGRASLFAAFEVIGERFGLGQQMEALRAAARGMPSDQIIGLLWSALKKEVPGEVLTTTGQFATDKFAPGGVGLAPDTTFHDYAKQLADTITQTIMQSALMAGGTTGVSAGVRYVRDAGRVTSEREAEIARMKALEKWERHGLAPKRAAAPNEATEVTPDGRLEPELGAILATGAGETPPDEPPPPGEPPPPPVEPTPPAGEDAAAAQGAPSPAPPAGNAHPTSQAADEIVRDLAAEAGIPLETVLPTSGATAGTSAGGSDGALGDQDVLDFAAGRYQQLRTKRDGQIETTIGETGATDQDVPGVGLSPDEQQELAGLEQARGNLGALRALYGLDQDQETNSEASKPTVEPPSLPPPVEQEPGASGPRTTLSNDQIATALIVEANQQFALKPNEKGKAFHAGIRDAVDGKDPQRQLDSSYGIAYQWAQARMAGRAAQEQPTPPVDEAPDLDRGARQAPPPAPIWASAIVQRQVNAADRFVESATEQFGLTREEAGKAWDYYVQHKLVEIDSVGGQYTLKDGRLWDGALLREAAGRPINPRTEKEARAKSAQRKDGNGTQAPKTQQAKAQGAKREQAPTTRAHLEQVGAGDAGAANAITQPQIPAIAQALQNRNRASAASAMQMQKIAADPNPRLLMAAPTMGDGAPVATDLHGTGKAVLGASDVIVTGKREIAVRYAVVEATDLAASNFADGSRNQNYAVDPKKLVAINNGRAAGLIEAYARGTAGKYRAAIEAAQHVHDIPAETIRAMRAPVLVRLMNPADVTENIGDESNTAMTLGLSAVEQARNDAGRFDATSIEFLDDGRPTDASIRGFIAAMPEAERQTLAPDGRPTRQAIDRMQAATFYTAYEDAALVELMAQATDPDARNVLAGLSRAAGAMTKLKEAGNLDIRSIVAEAAKIIVNAARSGVSMRKFLAQQDAYDTGAATLVAHFFAENSRSSKMIAERLADAAEFAYAESLKTGEDMFGESIPRASRDDVLRRITNGDDTRGQTNVEQPQRGQSYGRDAENEAARKEGQADARRVETSSVAGRAQGQRGQRVDDRPALALESHTQNEIRERERRIEEAAKEAARLEAELARKEKADRERDTFTLTGSDRPADDSRQSSLFTHARSYGTLDLFETLDVLVNPLPAAPGARPHPDTAATAERARLGATAAAFVRGRAGSLLGLAFAADWTVGRGSDLVGKTVASPADLATLAAVLRDPRVETLRYFFVKDNKIVHHEAVSSGLYDEAAPWPGGDSGLVPFMANMRAKMERLGADGYYMMHNHPSTIMVASAADVNITGLFAQQLPGFRGHVILDHGQFVFVNHDGTRVTENRVIDLPGRTKKDPLHTAAMPHPALGEFVSSPDAFAQIADRVRDPENVVLVATNAQLKVTAVSSVPRETISKGGFNALYAIARLRKAAGSNAIFAVLPVGMPVSAVPAKLFTRGWFMDANGVAINGDRYASGGTTGRRLTRQFRPGRARMVEQPSKDYATGDLFGAMSEIEREAIVEAKKKNSPQMSLFDQIDATHGKDPAAQRPAQPQAVLARRANKEEQHGAASRKRGFASIPPRSGFDVVYKPYGNTGDASDAGYYYVPESATMEQGGQANGHDQRDSRSLERDRRGPETQNGVGEESIRAGRGSDRGAGESGVARPAQTGDTGSSRGRLPGRETAPVGEEGDFSPFAGQSMAPAGATGDLFDLGSGDVGFDGPPVEPAGTEAVEQLAQGGLDLGKLRREQQSAGRVEIIPGDRANIDETLPALLTGQRDDVAFAERRFAKPEGRGVLFTNGTGTGKTFSGLGIIKRFERQGKTNTLIVAPSDTVASAWVRAGKILDLDITLLGDTQDAGKGIVITTYANFGQNDALVRRAWDLVVTDEAHYLMQAKDGRDTLAIDKLRAITLHPRGVYARHSVLYRKEIERQDALDKRIKANVKIINNDDTMAQMVDSLRKENAGLRAEAAKLAEVISNGLAEVRAEVDAAQGASRPRAVFLSATPFAYEKTVDYAEGYLFDYEKVEGRSGYNVGGPFERFMMQHFGYRMRNNKLTEPEASVNRGLMQRQFNSWLKREGVLSSRMLTVEHDYDRKFILTESAIGRDIDRALQWLWDREMDQANPNKEAYYFLHKKVRDQFDHLARRYLLEAIKAKEAIPIIRQHLALGRKVVVFHDFKKGGGFNPFRFLRADETADDPKKAEDARKYNAAVEAFNAEFAELIASPMWASASPIEALTAAFPDALLFNGDVPASKRREHVELFQSDDSGRDLIIGQSAAMREGVSLHDTTGKHQRVLINLGLPTQPTTSIQQEGRIFRVGQASNAMFRYLNTGTNWERWAFAETIAQRSSTAENLALGEEARALVDAYVQGFEESDAYPPGHEGEGTGGKERDRAANQSLTEWDRATTLYFSQQKKTSRTKAAEGVDYFATPEPLGLKMVEWADVQERDEALEPSAGHGAIARWLPDNINRTVVEPSAELASRLKMVMAGEARLLQERFEDLHTVNKYDVVVMNPPFGTAGRTAVDHLAKAAAHLRDGGRIVALIPTGPAADAKFDKWFYGEEPAPSKPLGSTTRVGAFHAGDIVTLDGRDGEYRLNGRGPLGLEFVPLKGGMAEGWRSHYIASVKPGARTEMVKSAPDLYLAAVIKLPAVTFERAGTSVATRVVVIDKHADPANAPQQVSRDFSDAQDIKTFFERIRDSSIPPRAKTRSTGAQPAPERSTATPKAEAPASGSVAGEKYITDAPEIAYTTRKGKVIHGVIAKDITKEQAEAIDPYTWKKDGGYFIRLKYVERPASVGQPQAEYASADDLRFAADVMAELSEFDEFFRYPVSQNTSVAGIMKDIFPGARYVGEITQEDERNQSGADHVYKFKTHEGSPFFVFERDPREFWINVAALQEGENGSAIYAAVANLAHNVNGKFMGDPAGLSEAAIERRTSAMLASALRFGTARHLDAAREQLAGVPGQGIEPLDWWGNDVAKVKALIHTFVTTLENRYPKIKDYRYDFDAHRFKDQDGRFVTVDEIIAVGEKKDDELLHPAHLSNERGHQDGRGNFDRGRLGKATVRRGIFLKSLVSSASGERPRILEQLLRGARGQASPLNSEGALNGMLGEPQAPYGTSSPSNTARQVRSNLVQFFGSRKGSLKTFGAYDKTLSTQYHKALKDHHYGKVFGLVNAMQNEVSLTSIRPAELAPGILPRVDDVKSALGQIVKGKRGGKRLEQATAALFAGTLAGDNVLEGKVWTEAELRDKFNLDDTGVALYRQARAAIDASLDELAAAEAYAMVQDIAPKGLHRLVIDDPRQAEGLVVGGLDKQIKVLDLAIKGARLKGNEKHAEDLGGIRAEYLATKRKVEKVFNTAKNLKLAGYAPLMRFGKYTVTVQAVDPTTGASLRDQDGNLLTEYFGKFETQAEARAVQREMETRYADQDILIRSGVDSQSAHELYAGVSPETVALFGDAVGATEVTRKYYQMALSERSALKRRLERKGTAGFSHDLPRVLSTFITSNGRFAAQRYYLRDLNNAIKYIPQEKGDVKDEALRLKQFVMNPKDPGAPISSALFAWFLGGSVASAAVNLTQPIMMTGPYLSQFGVGVASKCLLTALPAALGKKEITDPGLRAALKRASQEGIVDAQEIFHLYTVGAQGVAAGLVSSLARIPGAGGMIKAGSEGARARVNAFLTLWGSMFSLAEGFNRRLTFIAAWGVAKANKEADPYAFAVRAVNETQGIYNKVNRPNWARNPAGRVILTFKQFSLMYIELLSRMWKRGGPEGKRAALIMLAVLMLAAGEEGLPFAQDLDDLVDTVGQLFGFDTNMRRNKRRLAHEILGKHLGDLFLYGASTQLPLDFAGRLGLGNLIPGTGLAKFSNEQGRDREVAEVFGPAAGMGVQFMDAYDAAVEGNPGKALQNLAPKAVKDIVAGAEMARKGYATDPRGHKVVDVGLGDAVVKGFGFNPTKVAQTHRKTMPIQQDISTQKRAESSIVDQWVRGIVDDDAALVEKARARKEAWNNKNPDTPIVIGASQIRARVRGLAAEKSDRVTRQAPREMRGRVGLEMLDEE